MLLSISIRVWLFSNLIHSFYLQHFSRTWNIWIFIKFGEDRFASQSSISLLVEIPSKAVVHVEWTIRFLRWYCKSAIIHGECCTSAIFVDISKTETTEIVQVIF